MPVVRIDSLGDSRLDVFARLTEAQLRNKLEPEKGVFIAESFKVIDRALTAGYEPLSLLMEEKWLEASDSILARVGERSPEAPVFVLPSQEIQKLTGFQLTRGILCAMRRPVLPDAKDLLLGRVTEGPGAHLDRPAQRIAVLEGIVDHTNVGALFRSAAALGVDAVLVTPTCCDPLYRRSARVSMGTVFQVPWTRIGATAADWPDAGIGLLRELGFKTAAMALSDDSVPLADPALNAEDKVAIILGTEGDGLADRTIAQCDYTVRIPMKHGVDSLNVAAASAVAFYQLCQLR
ncbi:MAG: RNA methyltransferase [Coriobacteriia bacterium]|nr:RNA methyltransferase [Coriobacteriia bacterium]